LSLSTRKKCEQDAVTAYLLRHHRKLTQRAYLDLNWGDGRKRLEDLGPEERADLPENFYEWPKDEYAIN